MESDTPVQGAKGLGKIIGTKKYRMSPRSGQEALNQHGCQEMVRSESGGSEYGK